MNYREKNPEELIDGITDPDWDDAQRQVCKAVSDLVARGVWQRTIFDVTANALFRLCRGNPYRDAPDVAMLEADLGRLRWLRRRVDYLIGQYENGLDRAERDAAPAPVESATRH